MVETEEQLGRVADKLTSAVREFVDELEPGDVFHELDLVMYCRNRLGAGPGKAGSFAPGSPGRILRLLRKRGVVDYEVENRRLGEYKVL